MFHAVCAIISFKFSLLFIWMVYACALLHQLNSEKPVLIPVISSLTCSSSWLYSVSGDPDFRPVHRKCIILHPSQMPVTRVLTSLWNFLEIQQHSLCSSLLCVSLNHCSETLQFPQYRYLLRSLSIIQLNMPGFDLSAGVFASFVMLHFMSYTTKISSFKLKRINMS